MQISTILLGLVLIVNSGLCWNYTCPDNNETVNLDLTQFAGEWYMIAGTPIGPLGKCSHFNVVTSDKNFSVNFTTTSSRNNKRVRWEIKGQQSENGLSATWRFSTSSRILGPFRHQVLTVDYEKYCAMIVCANDTSIIPKQMFAIVLSREKTLPNNILSNMKNIIGKYINKNAILNVDNRCNNVSL